MEKKVFKSSGLPIRKTVSLLPEIFQTANNDKFLNATLDALVQPGSLEKQTGYIGRSYGKSYNTKDTYLDVAQTLRHAYQLEPGFLLANNENKVEKFYDYLDFKNQQVFFGSEEERDNRINAHPHYTWNPPVDWDKLINYREYYWLPTGPDVVEVYGQSQDVVSSYRVRSDGADTWIFYPDGLKRNPAITLYRGQTYEFNVNSPGDHFWIRSSNLLGAQGNYNKGVTNNGTEVGKVTFKVPNDAPDLLYYQSADNIDRVGSFRIANIKDNTVLDVETEVLGKPSYTSSNGVAFTNGLKVTFVGKITPEKYSTGSWFVEGVGKAIRLVEYKSLELPALSNPDVDVVFDATGFDAQPFDNALSFPTTKDYITIDRASIDKNPWSRYNRWFHRSVIEYAAKTNGIDATLDEAYRAKRPIIEYVPDLQLFNHGAVAKQSVDLVDTFTTDVFSTIEGSAGYNIDKVDLADGMRVLFTADEDQLVKNKIYVVNFITVQSSTNVSTHKQISLVEAEDVNSAAGECVIVQKGSKYGGKMFHFDGTDWQQSQDKTTVNQAPLFNVFDKTGVSLADSSVYGSASSFTGTTILQYKPNSAGVVDTELGFALSYLNINNVGDILFESSWETQTFTWKSGTTTNSGNIRSGFYRTNKDLTTHTYGNTWEEVTHDLVQPIIQVIKVDTATNAVESDACLWNTGTKEKILFYKNNQLINDSFVSEVSIKRKFTFNNTKFVAGDIVTIKLYTDAVPDLGFYEFPDALEKNPLNENLKTFTLGQAGDHLRSMTELFDGFVGDFPGTSNLRDITGYQNYGRRFLKQSGISALALPFLCDKNINIIKSLRHASKEYERFKNAFLRYATELSYDFDNITFVDNILTVMAQNKDANYPFADSDMIGSGAYSLKDYTVEDEGIKTFALTDKFDLTEPSTKAVYVYHNGNQLIHDKDYVFDSTFGFVRLNVTLAVNDNIQIREYYSTSFSFMPATPTKLGLRKKYLPRIYVDDTYLTPTKVIQGHDGSITVAFDDFRDDLLLELELRIYNNIKTVYNENLFDFDKTFGSYYDKGIHAKEVLNKVLNSEFLRWGLTAGVPLWSNENLDLDNAFTYTYDRALDRTGQELMPRFWRGIYSYLYDTDHPHTNPWEMLGFSEKPTWWEDEYGPAPYTSGNLILWNDLRDGIIRQGDRAGKHERYARPTLLDILPVDEDGKLLSPLENRSVVDYASSRLSNDFQFGDIAPVEYSWRRSSAFQFSMVAAASILRPFEFISLSLDRSMIERNILNQIVSKATGEFVGRSDIVSALDTPVGILSYLKDYLKATLSSTESLSTLIKGFDLRLSNRIGGFVDKAQQKYLLDSKNPNSTSSGNFIPQENYQIFFNVSSPIKTITYSGVVIEKVDSGWKISGYDNLNTYFTYYDFFEIKNDPIISVGGVSENFVDWGEEKFYGSGVLVRYNTKFYRAKSSHTSGTAFDENYWATVAQVPVVGAVEVVKRTQFNRKEKEYLEYDTVLETNQQVSDFLLGYSEWLQDQGMVFDSFDSNLELPNNWEKSVKEFLFWTSHNWAAGALIALSPSATQLKITSVGGVADNLLDSFYDYSVAKSDGIQLGPEKIDIKRSYNELVINPVDTRDGIYFVKVNYVLKEHVVVFDDRTVFNDVVFDKGPGYRQERIKVLGFRTTDWDGDYTSPGFIYDDVNIQTWQPNTDYRIGDIVKYKEYTYTSLIYQRGKDTFVQDNWEKLDSIPTSGLVSNFDYKINQFEDYYDLDSVGLNADQKALARHAVGYQQREYLQDIIEDDVSQYKMYQGFIREKGTQNSITKMFDKVSSLTEDAVVLNEEWAFLLGSFGGSGQTTESEIQLKKEQLKLNPQPIILNSQGLKQQEYQNYILVKSSDYQIGESTTFPTSLKDNDSWTGGYVYVNDVDFVVKNKEDLLVANVNDFNHGSLLWVTFAPTGWELLRYRITDVLVIGVVAIGQNDVSVTCNKPHGLKVGDYVGLSNIKNLSGFYQVKTLNPNTFIVSITGFTNEPEIDESSFCKIGIFESARISDVEGLVDGKIATLPVESLVWIDSNENGKWQVVKRKQQYVSTQISEYGIAFPTGTGSSVAYLNSRNQTIVSNPGALVTTGDATRESAVIVYSQGTTGLIPLQILTPQDSLKAAFLGSYGSTVTTSKDGRWLAVGSANASYVPSTYQETFSPSKTYKTDDTVIYAGKLWRAKRPVYGDGSSIDLNSQDWEPVILHEASPLAQGILGFNQGYRAQGAVDLFEYTQGQWTFKHTIISPRPAHGELFGSSISIGKQEGIEGTSGDVTLVVKSINSSGGITSVDATGTSGLTDQLFQNISGIDVSQTGSGATFDVLRGVNSYTVTLRNGGTRYAIGDKFKIIGTRLGGSTPTNDLIITVTAVTTGGTIVGSETYTNVSGINSISPVTEAIFNISRNRTNYTVTMVNPGLGYVARSIVRYNSRLYACIKDTHIDRGVWESTRTYYGDEVVKDPNSSYYYRVIPRYDTQGNLLGVSGITPSDDGVYYEFATPILPTNQNYWQEVTGTVYATNAVPWVEKNTRTGELIRYLAGSTIFVPGTSLGGVSPANDVMIYVNKVNADSSIAAAGQGGFVFTGVGATGISSFGVAATGNAAYNDVTGEDVSEPGSGAIFDIRRESGTYTATINVAGSRYNVGDEIKILGTSLGATKEAYYMSVSAPGSLDNQGRVYLYSFEGIDWTQLDDPNFVGLFNANHRYPVNSVVWYNGGYWKALSDRPALSGAPSAPAWEITASTNIGMLPTKAAYEDDGSTIVTGTDSPEIALLNKGDLYGHSAVMSRDASVLVVGAINADGASFKSYKGVWKDYETYLLGDTVRYNGVYYKVVVGASVNEIPDVVTSSWDVDTTFVNDKTGAVFIYNKDSDDVYRMTQHIDSENINSYLTDSTEINISDKFGYDIKLSDDNSTLFVSAPQADINGIDQGAVFVFSLNTTSGLYEFVQKLNSFNSDVNEEFGTTINLSPNGNTLAVAARSGQTYKDTTFDKSQTQFDRYVAKFRDPVGRTGTVYVYEKYKDKYVLSEIFDKEVLADGTTKPLSANEDFGHSIASSDDAIIIGSPAYRSEDPAFKEIRIGRIQKFNRTPGVRSWETYRIQSETVDIEAVKTLAVYDPERNIKITDLDILDPYKGKILSVAEEAIDFKTSYDPAVYSYAEQDVTVDSQQYWADEMVGTIWWNTSTIKWPVYEQDDLAFRIGNWAAPVYGSSVDVYEWVKTSYLPSEWADFLTKDPATAYAEGLSGNPLYVDDTALSVKKTLDSITGKVIKIEYYYWVKSRQILPESGKRRITAGDISNYISSPVSSGLPFAAIVKNDTMIVYNLLPFITSNEFLVDFEFYRNADPVNLVHREYQLLAEGVADDVPTGELELKWIDSLVGQDKIGRDVPDRALPARLKYGISSNPRQSMFVDRNAAVGITVDYINGILASRPFETLSKSSLLNANDPAPTLVSNLYDLVVDTKPELSYIATAKIEPAVLKANIVNGKIDTVDVISSGYGYRKAPPVVVHGNGSGAEISTTINKFGQVISAKVNSSGVKYTEANLFVREFAVLVNTDNTVNNYWSIWSWDAATGEFYRSATQSYDVRNYWTETDWWATGFNEKSRIVDNIPGLYAEGEVDLDIGELLRIVDYGSGGWAVLQRVESADATILGKYKIVGRKLGTIQILNKFVNTETRSEGYDQTQSYDSEGYDASAAKEFRLVLEAIRDEVFVDDLKSEWNKLFFANIHYVFAEQHYVDWAFKTSFLNAIHNVGYFSTRNNYKNDGLSSYQKYIEEVKPYRTKVREFTSRYLGLENTNTAVSDFDLPPVYNVDTNTIEPVKGGSTGADSYPWKFWTDNHAYTVTDIVITFAGVDYKTVPYVIIEGGGGQGAAAKAYLSNGKVSRVVVTNPGSGYTSRPDVYIVGGVGTRVNDVAKAVAVIGDSKARTFDMTVKFDRYSKTPGFKSYSVNEKFIETETLTAATGQQTVWTLKYPPTEDKSKISVIVGGVKLLKNEYTISLYTVEVDGLTVLKGKITLTSAPAKGTTVRVVYEKNDEILDALNRIDKYYKPTNGMLGLEKNPTSDVTGAEVVNDYSQLVTGIDYGGVIVQGATFDVSGGWDALPWFTDGWDSADRLTADYYLPADGTTNEFTLPAIPEFGAEYNIYIKKKGSFDSIRLDDPNYDAYVANPSLPTPPNPYAVMNTWYGDGSTSTIIIPNTVTIDQGDVMIFRPVASDGVSTITDKNMLDVEISGGTLRGTDPYTTATGRTAEEIVLDGETFISPTQVPAPEENVPGQVIESVSIKVFHSDRQGGPSVLSMIYTSDGVKTLYDIGQDFIENSSIIVFVDKVKQVSGTDYTINHSEAYVRFLNIPTAGQIVEIFSMAVGGVEIIDYRDFIGDGVNRYFLTAAPFSNTGHVYATVDGVKVDVGVLNSNTFQNDIDKALIEFGNAPEDGKQVSIVVFSAESGQAESLTRINNQTFVIDHTVKIYPIESFVTLEASDVGNALLEYNGKLLRSVDTVIQTYTGSNNIVIIGQDPFKNAGDIVQSKVKVYVNNALLKFGSDYEFNGETKQVTVTATLKVGDIIRVEDYSSTLYDIVNNSIVLSDDVTLTDGDTMNLIWADNYAALDLVKDIYTGGKISYPLQRKAIGISYVWVYVNGDRLTRDIDFWIDYPNNTVYLKEDTQATDFIEIVSFTGEIYEKPFGFEIFKDALNKYRYVRYNIQDVVLAQPLNYFDTSMTVSDASNLINPTFNQLGIVQINGEKIQYLSKDGNVLKDLRRGIFGTAIGELYNTGSVVVDVNTLENLPYRDYQEKYSVISDGSTLLVGPLPAGEYGDPTEETGLKYVPKSRLNKTTGAAVPFTYRSSIPTDHYPCDEVEVFVGGRRLRKDPTTVFDPTVGAYSPAGDVQLEAEFSVDGTTPYVRLTSAVAAGTLITVIRRHGNTWYDNGKDAGTASNGRTLSKATTPVARFLQNKASKLP